MYITTEKRKEKFMKLTNKNKNKKTNEKNILHTLNK